MRLSLSVVGLAIALVCLSACGPDEPDDDDGFNLPTPTPPFTVSPSPTTTPLNQGSPTPTRSAVHQVVVQIDGTLGASFRGQMGDATSNQSIDGTIPATIPFTNARGFFSVSANLTESGRKQLVIEVTVDGISRVRQSAFSEFASLSVSVPNLDQ